MVSHTVMTRPIWGKGSGCSTSALTVIKQEALTPIPSARASTITAVVPGLLRIRRSASWRSRSRLFTTVGMPHVRGQTGSLWNQGPTPVSAVQLTVSGKLRPPEEQHCRRIRLCYRLSATTMSRPGHFGDLEDALPGKEIFRSEEHTSELQSLRHLVCRLLLEK